MTNPGRILVEGLHLSAAAVVSRTVVRWTIMESPKVTRTMSIDPIDQESTQLADELATLAAEVEASEVPETELAIAAEAEATVDADDVDALLASLVDDTADAAQTPIDADPLAEMDEFLAPPSEGEEMGDSTASTVDSDPLPTEIDADLSPLIDSTAIEAADLMVTADLSSLLDVTQAVSDGLAGAERKLEEIASAFEQATAELIGTPAALDPIDLPAPQANRRTPSSCPPGDLSIADLRDRLQEARTHITVQLDQLVAVVGQVEQIQGRAEQSLAKARAFEEAAREAHAAGQALTDAEAEAAQARDAFEQAQARVDLARRSWTSAQSRAAGAAQTAGPGN